MHRLRPFILITGTLLCLLIAVRTPALEFRIDEILLNAVARPADVAAGKP